MIDHRNEINYKKNYSNTTWDNGCTSEMYYTIKNPYKRWCMPSYYYTRKYNVMSNDDMSYSVKLIGIDSDIFVT